MKAPKPPPTPDPYETAAAQQMANVEVAVANTALQNADEDTPEGSVRFSQTDDYVTTQTYDGDGNVTGSRDVYRWKKVTTLTPTAQTQYDQQQEIAIAMNEWALAQTGVLQDQQAVPITLGQLTSRNAIPAAAVITTTAPTLGSFTDEIGAADLTAHIAATRDAIDARLQYQIDLDRAARIVQLAHQGLVPGMEAYDDDLYAFDKQSTDARIQAYLAAQTEQSRIIQTEGAVASFKNMTTEQKFKLNAAVTDLRNQRLIMAYQALSDAATFVNTQRAQEMQELIGLRAANVNEVTALMHGGQVQVPQFAQFRAGPIDRTPVADSVYQSAAMDMQKWQTRVQAQSQMMGGLLGFAGNMFGGMLALSDRRVKRDIRQIGTWRGLGVYVWRYLWGTPGVGLMAQEVLTVFPHAIHRCANGLLMIHYGRLHRG